MTDKIFADIWNCIEDQMKVIEKAFTDDQKKVFNFRRSFKTKSETIIHQEYEIIKNEFKQRLYDDGSENFNPDDHKLDQHKVAACLAAALISRKLFAFDVNEQTPERMLRSNYEIAVLASLNVIRFYMLYYYSNEYKGPDQPILYKKIVESDFKYPSTENDNKEYLLGKIMNCALNDFFYKEFDLLGYADTMFWIEHYNRILLERDIVPLPPMEIKNVP